MSKRLQVPIADEAIWEYDVNKVIDFAVSKLVNRQVVAQFSGLEYSFILDMAAVLRAELETFPDKVLDVARQMKWGDIDPVRDEVIKSADNKISLAENWDLVKHEKIKVR